MATVYLGAEPAPDTQLSNLQEADLEKLREWRTVRTFHYPKFSAGAKDGKVVYDLKVRGSLFDLDPAWVWKVFWSGNTPRTLIGDRLQEQQEADSTYPARVNHQVFLNTENLPDWLVVSTGDSPRRDARIAKDSMIAMLSAQNASLQEQIANLTATIAKLTQAMETPAGSEEVSHN